MRLLIDGNILLDVLQKREPYYSDSANIWKMCEIDLVEGHVPALTFANLVYVMRKELSPDRVEEILKALSLIFHFEDLKGSDLEGAAALHWTDYEDALQAVIAQRVGADYIITRNVKDFINSRVTAITPSEFLARQ
ncbi:MAG: PIN domain-containing protein [Lachnospiraceae bacterium]|nr:PIN domain-containing protein [Lachnospiraceae bacterium]